MAERIDIQSYVLAQSVIYVIFDCVGISADLCKLAINEVFLDTLCKRKMYLYVGFMDCIRWSEK